MKTCQAGILLLLFLIGCGSTDKPTAPSQPNPALSGAPPIAPSQPTATPAPMVPAAQLPPASQTPNSAAKAKAIYEENVYSQGEEYAASLALRQCGIRRGSQAERDFYRAIGKEPPAKSALPGTSSQTNLSTDAGGFKVPDGK